MKDKTLYAVLAVLESSPVTVQGFNVNLKLSWADGMIGAIPVFTNKKKAKKYAGKREIIILEKVVND